MSLYPGSLDEKVRFRDIYRLLYVYSDLDRYACYLYLLKFSL